MTPDQEQLHLENLVVLWQSQMTALLSLPLSERREMVQRLRSLADEFSESSKVGKVYCHLLAEELLDVPSP